MNRFNVASGRHLFPDGFFCRRRVIRGDDPNFERPRPSRRWLSRYANEDCSSHAQQYGMGGVRAKTRSQTP